MRYNGTFPLLCHSLNKQAWLSTGDRCLETDLPYQARGCLILRERRLHWLGHVERYSGAVRTACAIQIDGRWGAGRPKLTWKKLTEKDCCEWKLTTVDPQKKEEHLEIRCEICYVCSKPVT